MKLKSSYSNPMNKRLERIALSSLVAVLGVIGLGIGMPTPTMGQAISQVLSQDQAALAEAERLNRQIDEFYQQEKYNEAIPLAEKALAIRKKILGDNHLATARSLNQLAFLYYSQERYAEAEPLYKQALAIRKQQLGNNDPNTANSLYNLAELYRAQRRYTEAEPLHKQALAIRKQQLGNNDSNIADSLYNLAELYRAQRRYTEAEPLYQETLVITKAKLGDNHLNTASILDKLGRLYEFQGRYSEAESCYQQALAIRKAKLGDNHSSTATSLNNLANLYHYQGRYANAELLHKEALAIYKRQLGDNNLNTANSLNNLAELYESQGRYTEAETLYKQALAIRKQQLGDNDPSTALSLNSLADLYQSQGRYTEAETLYEQALAIYKRQLGDNDPSTALSLNSLADLYRSQGRYTEAVPLYKQALAIYKEQLGDNHPFTAISLNNLAVIYSSQGGYTEAVPLYKQALAIYKEQLGDNHPFTAISLNNLAVIYSSQDNIPRAMEYLTKGIEVEEFNLSENLIAGDERQKRDYMATVSGTTDGVISLNLQSASNNSEAMNLALITILQRKGRILDVLTNSLQILRQRIDDPKSQELLTQFINIRTQQANLNFKKPEDYPFLGVYRQQLVKLNAKAQQLEDQLSRRSAEFRTLSQPITLEAIQKLIPANSALVEIVRYKPLNFKATKGSKKWGEPRYAVYILYPNGDVKSKDLGEAKPIEDKLTYFRNQLLDKDKTPIEQVKEAARQLDEKLMKPVRQLLGNTKTILLSPDAALNLIPFEALVDETNQYLVENYHITYLTSGRDLLRLQLKSPAQQSPIIIADPLYNQRGKVIVLNPNSTRSVDLSEFTFSRLPGTKQEADALKALLPQTIVLTQSQATENALKQANRPTILHIATHGFFLEAPITNNNVIDGASLAPPQLDNNPLLRSGLVLTGVKIGQSAGDDGVLTALETTTLNLVGTKLVVLSACDTGNGDITTGEGVYGLRRALVIAGSESQVISLWKVSDEATKDLMLAYYGRLKKGEERSEALRRIQLEMLKSENHQHPFYWASFILSGDWTPMEFSSFP